MSHETEPHESGARRSESLTSFILIGLLVVQTALLGLLIVRINSLQDILVGGPGGAAAPEVAEEVIDVDPGDGPEKGAPEAPVTIVEFSCFTCPACADIQAELERTLERYPDRVRLAFRYFPLRLEGKPIQLAKAAECARRQGKFWQAHDLLFSQSATLESEDQILTALEPVGLDREELSSCFASAEVEERVLADFEAGRSYGVDSTPTLFINGRRVQGADFTILSQLVEASLEETEEVS